MEDFYEQNQLEGVVSAIIYQNEENGYTILRLDVKDEEITVVGSMPGVSPGEYLTIKGRWVRHATYGQQFRADIVERRLPEGIKEIFHYLSSGALKGVGKATARQLIEEFGEEALNAIEDPERLARIRGISPKRARAISEIDGEEKLDYDGVVFNVEVVADGVQEHNGTDAMNSAWGHTN